MKSRRQVQQAIAGMAVVQEAVGSLTQPAIGNGELELSITGVRELTPRAFGPTSCALDWGELPAASAGAHIEVPVRLNDGNGIYAAVFADDEFRTEQRPDCRAPGRFRARRLVDPPDVKLGTRLRAFRRPSATFPCTTMSARQC